MELVSKRQLPFSFGSPHPRVAVVEQDGVCRIRALVVDRAEAEAASREAFAKHQRWMPEDFYDPGSRSA